MERFISALLFLNVFVFGLSNPLKEALDSGKFDYEAIDVKVTDEMTYYNGNIQPSFHLKTKSFGEDIELRVKKLPSIFHENYSMLSLELDSNNKPVFRVAKLQNYDQAIYQDDNRTCALHLSYERGHLMMEGMLTPELSIFPSSSVGVHGPAGKHVVIKSKPGTLAFGFDYYGFTSPVGNRATLKIRKKQLPKVVNPELLVFVDYKNTKNMGFDEVEIQKYLAIFWNSVNTRYALVKEPLMELRLVGSVITKDPKLQLYIEDSRIDIDGEGAIDLQITLPALHRYVYGIKDQIPEFDIAMLMTAEDMAANTDEDFMDAKVAGAAPVGSACSTGSENDKMVTSVGMAEDNAPFFRGVLNHAHEVAHLLGSVHDGDGPRKSIPGHPGAKECSWFDGYLMSYALGSKNHLRWSNCTINQFRFFLSLDQASCLLSVSSTTSLPLNTTLPGQIKDLDEQCEAYMGTTAKYYREQSMVEICSMLYCHKEDEINEIISSGPAYEGSPCGYNEGPRRWCRDGVCRLRPTEA